MTSAVASPVVHDPTIVNGGERAPQDPPPKKRRRRTNAGGAGEDCFTCRNRAVKCDRKRPYCTQCMEIGNSCSGYKTTLTWGVGVASRGKLRGLACPVADKNIDGTDADPAEGPVKKRRKSSAATVKSEEATEDKSTKTRNASSARAFESASSQRARGHSNAATTQPVSVTQPQDGWQNTGYSDHVQSRPERRHTTVGYTGLQPLQTALGPQHDGLGMPHSARSIGSYAETEFFSPMEFPRTPGSAVPQFGEQLQQAISQPFSEPMPHSSMDNYSVTSAPIGGYHDQQQNGPSIASMCNFQDNGMLDGQAHDEGSKFDEEIFRQSPDSLDLLSRLGLMPDAELALNAFEGSSFNDFKNAEDELNDEEKGLMLADTRFSSPFFELPTRLHSLMSYYDAHICPFLVTFDGPQNPYRRHVLQLATQNTGLQHALAALSLNNHRMRRAAGQRPQIGFVEEITTGEPTAEETKYKQLSIDQLNWQLTDARAAQDDGVLATLLILCLFHVCDSGFSKFRTQLRGVQKLLSLRRPNTRPSDFTAWVEMFFIWFDVMTSTVNDREMQINNDSLAMLDYSTNLGALEQFSGCDGRLFKLIARLGRLNLLAQGRPVKPQADDETPLLHPSVPRPTKKRPTKFRTAKSLSPLDYEHIDGNGWGTPILSSDEEDAPGTPDSRAQSPFPPHPHPNNAPAPDSRQAFWTEWHALRSCLHAWQMDQSFTHATPPSPDTPSDPADLTTSQRDLQHINETFRRSALLYTERLAQPLLPSSHPTFQNLVSQTLYHITALPTTSCVNKFLLWPLFITGTECVDPSHRNMIRTRCRDLTEESGFFNNLSSLEVLERVWAEGNAVGGDAAAEMRARRRDSEALRSPGGVGQAFRWRKAMDRVDGEYIVI